MLETMGKTQAVADWLQNWGKKETALGQVEAWGALVQKLKDFFHKHSIKHLMYNINR